MSARLPTAVTLSLETLAAHGGGTGPHRDGWGIAFLVERDALLVREAEAASASPWVPFLESIRPKSAAVVAHVRRATQGTRALRNTQPFVRELGGRMHVFAHNGMLPGIESDPRFAARRFRTVGETDSEHAFCALLERLGPLWEHDVPPLSDRLGVLRSFATVLGAKGPANFLYSDGDVLVAHGHRRRHDDGEIHAPGLHVLCRTCTSDANAATHAPALRGVEVEPASAQEVALVASVPLSDEPWTPLPEGELLVLRDGRTIARLEA